MSKFRIKLPVATLVMIIVCDCFAVFATVWNLISLIKTPIVNVQRVIVLSLLVLLAVCMAIICTLSVAMPYYIIGKGKLKMAFGIFVSTFNLSSVTEIIYYKAIGKLIMFYGEEKYTAILLPENKHEDFVKRLREENPKIIYDNKINEND